MAYNDLIGTIGVALILLAYFLNTASLIIKNGKLFWSCIGYLCFFPDRLLAFCDPGSNLDIGFNLWIDESDEDKNDLKNIEQGM
jgi:hypothetical protein